jgi:hypothetical protein
MATPPLPPVPGASPTPSHPPVPAPSSAASETAVSETGEPTQVRDRTPAKVSGLSCPNCGGPLEVAPGLRVLVCGYCDTPLRVTGPPGVRRFSVAPEMGAEDARDRARKWLSSGWNKDRRLRREAEVGEAFLCFLPFFRVQADAVGYALGTEEHSRGSGKNRRTEEVDVEKEVERSLDRTFPAVQVAEWGVQTVDLKGDRLLPFDDGALEREGLVFPPTGSEAEIRDAALAEFRERVDPRRGMKRVRFFWLRTLRERLTLIYYPLWVVRYRFENRAYQVLVDAQDGRVAYGKAPGDDLYRAGWMVFSQMLAAFAATSLIQWGVIDDWVPLVLLGLFCIGILSVGWMHFRWGGVVVEGTGARKQHSAGVRWVRRFARGQGIPLPSSLGSE